MAELRAKGKKPYFIPGGGSNAIGSLGYVKAALSIVEASRAADKPFDAIVCCSGSGGTHSGMLAGLRAAGDSTPVYGISVRFESERQAANIHKQYVACAALFDVDAPEEDVVVVDSFVGPGYSLPTDQMKEAISLFAMKEGIFLDPVYTGKGAAGLIGLARDGTLKPGSKVLFLHTGGAPSLFALRSSGFGRFRLDGLELSPPEWVMVAAPADWQRLRLRERLQAWRSLRRWRAWRSTRSPSSGTSGRRLWGSRRCIFRPSELCLHLSLPVARDRRSFRRRWPGAASLL